MKISEIITDKYKLRIPPTVYYDLLADVRELEEEQEPTTKNDLGVDLISRNEVLNRLASIAKIKAKSDAQKSLMGRCMFMVERMPSVTPQEPRKGHWKDIPKYKDIAWQCSECKHLTPMKHNYYPNCGADMREEL